MTDRLTNAIEFGAPQDRDRILLFGVSKSLFPQKTDDPLLAFPWDKYIVHSLEEIKNINWPTTNPFSENAPTPCPAGIPKELTVQYWFDKTMC